MVQPVSPRTRTFIVSAWGLSLAGAAMAQAPVALERLDVTGSRIHGANAIQRADMAIFSAEDIRRSGSVSVAHFLQSLPWNAGGLATTAQPVAMNAAQQGVNLRGLGGNNTLVLLNGRRVAPFGQTDGSRLSADLGNLPAAAIDSIEVLREGASAIYGSDAVGGVINIKLKKKYEGVSVGVDYRQFEDTDLSLRAASATVGAQAGGVSLLAVVDYSASNDVRFSDRPVSRTEDLRAAGGRDLRQNFGWPGQLFIPENASGVPTSLRNRWVSIGTMSEGVVTIAAPARTVRAEDFVPLPANVTGGAPTPGDSQNNFDRAPHTSLLPAEEAHGVYLRLERVLGDRSSAFAEIGWRERVLTSSLHPTPAGTNLESSPGVGDGSGGAIVFPAENPYNPFGIDFSVLQFHLVELGPRVRRFTNRTPRVLAGLRGEWDENWSWEAAVLFSENEVREETSNYITDADLQAGLAGRLGGFLNPFGLSDPGVVDRARTSLQAVQTARIRLVDAQATGELLRLPAGPLMAAFGAEVRNDEFVGEPGELAARGAYVAWAALTRQRAKRDVAAAFAEVTAPVTRTMAARGAVRLEDYSDFGRTTKPTLGLEWRVVSGSRLHVSRSEAFKAPELLDLHASQTETYATIDDPRRPELGSYSVRYRRGGNPGLRPEESVAWQAGAVVTAPAAPGLEMAATWWRIGKQGMVGALGLSHLLAHELDPGFPTRDRIVRAAASDETPGAIQTINDTIGNIDQVTVAGWDVDVSQRWRSESWGELQLKLSGAWMRDYTYVSRTAGARQMTGMLGMPEWRATGTLAWDRNRWAAALRVDWIGHNDGTGTNYLGGPVTQHARTFVNSSFDWRISPRMKIGLAATNVFDASPPQQFDSSRGYNVGFYDNHGRAYAVRIETQF